MAVPRMDIVWINKVDLANQEVTVRGFNEDWTTRKLRLGFNNRHYFKYKGCEYYIMKHNFENGCVAYAPYLRSGAKLYRCEDVYPEGLNELSLDVNDVYTTYFPGKPQFI